MSVRKTEKTLRFESLESRSVMAASAFAAFAKTVAPAIGAATSIKNAPPAFIAPALGKSAGAFGAEVHKETKLVATIVDPTATNKATGFAVYEQETERGATKTEFVVAVQGALPNTKLDVTMTTPATATTPESSVVIGQITTDVNGNGKLVVKTSSKTTGGVTFPTTVDATTVVKIGTDLTGTLAIPTKPTKPEKPSTNLAVTRIGASLSDSTGVSTLKASINYESVTINGTVMSAFRVCVSGGKLDQVVDVTISSTDATTGVVTKTLVGTIKLDANGKGQLLYTTNSVLKGIAQPFPKDFPVITPGLTVQVDTLTGTLATLKKKS